MNIESHKKGIKESLDAIKEALNSDLISKQRTIGFHCSASVIDMLEIYLHKKNIIDPGFTIKHDFFGSEKMAQRRLSFEFENKQELIKLFVKIEEKRSILYYGRSQSSEYIEKYLDYFNKAKKLLESMGIIYE